MLCKQVREFKHYNLKFIFEYPVLLLFYCKYNKLNKKILINYAI